LRPVRAYLLRIYPGRTSARAFPPPVRPETARFPRPTTPGLPENLTAGPVSHTVAAADRADFPAARADDTASRTADSVSHTVAQASRTVGEVSRTDTRASRTGFPATRTHRRANRALISANRTDNAANRGPNPFPHTWLRGT